jgi:hypothetical protein
MLLADKIQELILSMGWNDVVIKDEENQSSSVNFRYNINEQSFSVTIETDEARDAVKFYIQAPFNVLTKQVNEMALLLNRINIATPMGAFIVYPDGSLVWRHMIDFENIEPSTVSLNNNMGAGINCFREWFEQISAVALTKTTAEDIFNELEENEVMDEV